ncbi:hypothetical protein AB0M48_19125 [Lentzea sp. NPDC051208]
MLPAEFVELAGRCPSERRGAWARSGERIEFFEGRKIVIIDRPELLL